MKRLIIIIALSLSSIPSVVGQNISQIDSLYSALKRVKGVEQIDIYNALAWEYRKSHPDSTVYFSNKAIGLTKILKFEGKIAKSLNYIGVAYHYKGDQVKSFDYYNLAVEAAIRHNDSSQYAHSLNNLGRLFSTQGDFVKSYDYYFTALEIFERLNDKEGLSYCYKSLSELYQTQNNYKKALEMSQKALEIRLGTDNIPGQVSMLLEMAQIQEHNKNYEKAFDYYLQAKVKAESIDDFINIANINIGISHLYYIQHKFPEALIFAQKASNMAGNTGNLNLLSRIDTQLGKVYFIEENFDKARHYFSKVLETASRSRELMIQLDAYYYLAEICEQKGDVNCAYENFQRYAEVKQALNNAEMARAIERSEARLEIEKRDKENELLLANQARDQAVIDRQRTYNVTLVVIVVAIFALVINLWVTSRKRRRANEKLHQKNIHIARQQEEIREQNDMINAQNKVLHKHNQDLAELNNEKDTLMNIVAHDLKSPFNRIKGIGELLLLSGLTAEQRNYVKLLKSISQSGIDLIRDLLDVNAFEFDKRKPEISKVDIYSLLLDKVKGFYADAKSKQIELRLEGGESQIFINSDKVYLSRVLDNLISNAIKFSDPGNPVILSVGRTENYTFISVKDFGQGFTEEDKQNIYKKFTKLSAQPTAGESSNGLGLAIVKTLVDRLEAEIELKTEIDKGSEFIIKFPSKITVPLDKITL
ncbi:tetratricopeptide repeat-containing sensor histidine kinase [Fulvivirga sp. 29W222]|uniref:histidine kinase n=1 Tax=Fulvivirga marina TaxID=2494733 RepID=A0A937KFH1_9BACT|nr:tetratricopeptide repeat protein [Fulvivirga marina]MBL6448188.1 tetratricopeptide repeat-containing sensor histidine kinase [Fulvivirga marina]